MAERGAWICGLGMVTAVGGNAEQTAAAVRAGINQYQESSIYNRRFEPMSLALVPEDILPPLHGKLEGQTGLTSRHLRMLRLADPALKEATQGLKSLDGVPIVLAGPEPIPDHPSPMGEKFPELLSIQAEVSFDVARSEIFPTGRAGGLQALEAGIKFLEKSGQEYVVVGGVDTYLDLYLLATLDMEDRVLASGVMDGFAPGEGAAFVLMTSSRSGGSDGLTPLAFVYPPGFGQEAGHRYSEQTYSGDGLAEAISTAVKHANGQPVRTVFASLNGENLGAKEWGVAYLRNKSSFEDLHRFEHPADCFGDTGAAVGLLSIGIAVTGMRKGYLPSPSLIWCASERALRGAVCTAVSP